VKFVFETTLETQGYCEEVVNCIVKYGNKPEAAAVELVNLFWKDKKEFFELDFRLHEDPYYWAMCIIHDRSIGDNRPHWEKDPALSPPPKEFLDRWYTQS